jgi:hypothetical protein
VSLPPSPTLSLSLSLSLSLDGKDALEWFTARHISHVTVHQPCNASPAM